MTYSDSFAGPSSVDGPSSIPTPRIHPGWDLPGLDEAFAAAFRTTPASDILPAQENILRAFEMDPKDVRVLIVGQDPYPTPGHAVGLSFAVDPLHVGGKLPKSLVNIFKEYSEDLDLPYPTNANAATLQPWIDEGVLLLNRVLTVAAGQAHSHARLGWEQVTEAAVRQVANNEHFAAILWGKPAQQLAPLIGQQRCVMSPHPSPLSAYRGFFGSRPFSKVNEILLAQGGQPVDWNLADSKAAGDRERADRDTRNGRRDGGS